MSGTTIWDRLMQLDRRWYYWVLFILLMVPFVKPVGLPLTIATSTRALYDSLQEVNEGDVVNLDLCISVATWPECMPGLVVFVNELIDRGAKMTFVSSSIDVEMSWNRLNELVPRLKTECTYGEDHVFLGYYTGGAAAVAQMAVDMKSIFPEDHYGTPLEQIPLMTQVNKATDYDLHLGNGECIEVYIQQWGIPFGTRIGANGIAMKGSTLSPYFKSGNLVGLAVGVRGGAELEMLAGLPADATTRMDSISLSHSLFVVLIILANIGYLLTRGKR
jgi:hypothetical protein